MVWPSDASQWQDFVLGLKTTRAKEDFQIIETAVQQKGSDQVSDKLPPAVPFAPLLSDRVQSLYAGVSRIPHSGEALCECSPMIVNLLTPVLELVSEKKRKPSRANSFCLRP